MKIIITENQYKKLVSESIKPEEAYSDVDSVKSICNNKRGVAFISLNYLNNSEIDEILNMVNDCDLKSIKVKSNPYDAWIIFKLGYENRAKRLLMIAEKYNGFLTPKATEEETREIGRILEYDEDSVEDFLKRTIKYRT